MRRTRWLTGILLLIVLAAIIGGYRERPQRPASRRVGVLLANTSRVSKLEGLKAGLAELGYTEGKDLVYIVKNADGNFEQVYTLAQQLYTEKPEVLVAGGRLEAQALMEATKGQPIPVVFMGAASIKGNIVPSHVTGVDNFHTELAAKRLEFLVRLLPHIRRVLVLVDPRVVPGPESLSVLQQAAYKLKLQLEVATVSSLDELGKLLLSLKPGSAEGMLLTSSLFFEEGGAIGWIARVSKSLRLPVMGVNVADAEAGLLAAYGCPFKAQGRQAARLVGKILQGQDPATIPVETPDRLELVVNLEVVQSLGLEISPDNLKYADRIIGKQGEGFATREN